MAKKMKKKLTQAEEFEIMKLVFDKFLWLGVGILAYGFYSLVTKTYMQQGISFIVAGVIILGLFLWLLVKEYEILS